MPNGVPPWRLNLQPASFNGVGFYVEVQNRAGGRRQAPHEFPKKDIGWTEDMGRRLRRWNVAAYLIYSPERMPDWQSQRDLLIAQLEAEGPGLLILPTGLQNMTDEPPGQVVVDNYTFLERRERGGWCEFEINFIEAGQSPSTNVTTNTQATATSAAQNTLSAAQQSNDLSSYGNSPTPIGPGSAV
jgi:prophage DNA circulation protein